MKKHKQIPIHCWNELGFRMWKALTAENDIIISINLRADIIRQIQSPVRMVLMDEVQFKLVDCIYRYEHK